MKPKDLLHQMKCEIANELGIFNYDSIDKGNLPARINGKIGGEMTKRLIKMGKKQLELEMNRELVPVYVRAEKKNEKRLEMPLDFYDEPHSKYYLNN